MITPDLADASAKFGGGRETWELLSGRWFRPSALRWHCLAAQNGRQQHQRHGSTRCILSLECKGIDPPRPVRGR